MRAGSPGCDTPPGAGGKFEWLDRSHRLNLRKPAAGHGVRVRQRAEAAGVARTPRNEGEEDPEPENDRHDRAEVLLLGDDPEGEWREPRQPDVLSSKCERD